MWWVRRAAASDKSGVLPLYFTHLGLRGSRVTLLTWSLGAQWPEGGLRDKHSHSSGLKVPLQLQPHGRKCPCSPQGVTGKSPTPRGVASAPSRGQPPGCNQHGLQITGLNSAPLKNKSQPQSPEPVNLVLSGKSIFADIIKSQDEFILDLGWSCLNPRAGVLGRERVRGPTHQQHAGGRHKSQRQRPEWRIYEPRKAAGCPRPSEAEREAWNRSFLYDFQKDPALETCLS